MNCTYHTISSAATLSLIKLILYFNINDKNWPIDGSLNFKRFCSTNIAYSIETTLAITLLLAVWNCCALFLTSSWRNFRINLIISFINFNELNDRLPRLPRSINPNSCSSLLSTSKEIASGDDLRSRSSISRKENRYFSVSLFLE